MKQNTNQLEITITRDGEITREFEPAIVSRLGTAAVSHLQALGTALASKVGEYTTELVKPVILDAFDATHGTSLRAEYFEHKRELAVTAMRQEFEL